jgi:hypothetical protein
MYHTVIGGSGTQQIIRSYFPKTSCYSVYFKLQYPGKVLELVNLTNL